ncbi:MAG: DUF2887 domain-containing protein [Oscillatoriales cyanobacterium SM2_1_8]|nr:DUF2887 domain-containing protein [Oscillatoriales cyanobacterium SM2_1_8]
MKTDILFYGLLQAYPELVFELTGMPVEPGYDLMAVEVKERNFRFDGVLMPPPTALPTAPIWFVEVQFQKRAGFYRDFFTKVALYLHQFAVERPGRLLAILPSRAVDVVVPTFYEPQVRAGWLHRVYLDEWTAAASLGGELLKLAVTPEIEMPERVKVLREQAQGTFEEARVLEWLEALLVYRYAKRSREEIAQMFALGDLRETRVYQEALSEGIERGKQEGVQLGKQEGIQLGRQAGEAQLVLRLLTRRLGSLTIEQQQQIASLSLSQLEDLGEALLDWQGSMELTHWLNGL